LSIRKGLLRKGYALRSPTHGYTANLCALQCAELLPLCNRGLGPLAVTVLLTPSLVRIRAIG
jgi:hypothetical protein